MLCVIRNPSAAKLYFKYILNPMNTSTLFTVKYGTLISMLFQMLLVLQFFPSEFTAGDVEQIYVLKKIKTDDKIGHP